MAARKSVIIFAALLVCGAAAFGAYYYYQHKKPDLPVFDYQKFGGVDMANGSTSANCRGECDSDVSCTAYSETSAGVCKTFKDDPLTSWVEDGSSVLYVKKKDGDPDYRWSDWSTECSQPCGGGVLTRSCNVAGKCPGPATKPCNTQACDVFEMAPSGVMPFPEQPTKNHDNQTSKNDCDKICLNDPTCTGYQFGPSPMGGGVSCRIYTEPFDTLTKDTTMFSGDERMYVREPAVNGKWGPWPSFSSCACGVSHLERACASGTCKGPKYLHCPGTPCSYDAFEDLSMKVPS